MTEKIVRFRVRKSAREEEELAFKIDELGFVEGCYNVSEGHLSDPNNCGHMSRSDSGGVTLAEDPLRRPVNASCNVVSRAGRPKPKYLGGTDLEDVCAFCLVRN